MSGGGTSRSVLLKRWEFPGYWEEIDERPESPRAAIGRIRDLCAAYRSKNGECIIFCFEDSLGDALFVGCSRAGWVIMHYPQGVPGQIAVGDRACEGHQTFLFPEWSDMRRIYT